MEYIKRFFKFWYDFLIGNDLVGSLIVLIAFGLTYFVAHAHITAYWILMLAVLISLSWNVWKRVHAESG
jgi:hypothetical protein